MLDGIIIFSSVLQLDTIPNNFDKLFDCKYMSLLNLTENLVFTEVFTR